MRKKIFHHRSVFPVIEVPDVDTLMISEVFRRVEILSFRYQYNRIKLKMINKTQDLNIIIIEYYY